MVNRQWSIAECSVVVAMAVACPLAVAHPGPRVWLNVEGGQVTTYAGAYPPGSPGDYARSRVFTQAMTDEGEGVWDTDFPGYQMVPGGTIAAGTEFSFSIGGPLLWFNAGDASHAAKYQTVASRFGASGAPQFNVGNELFQSVNTGDGAADGFLAYRFNGGTGDHNHLTYTLLGDGATAVSGPDGIYALPLIFSASGVPTPSEMFYLLLGKNASAAQLNAAAALAGQTLLLPGDANADGQVNFIDFQRLELGFGKADAYPADGDFNFDGVVDASDFKVLYDHYGERLTGQAAPLGASPGLPLQVVPEPTTAALLTTIGLVALADRRGRRGRQNWDVADNS